LHIRRLKYLGTIRPGSASDACTERDCLFVRGARVPGDRRCFLPRLPGVRAGRRGSRRYLADISFRNELYVGRLWRMSRRAVFSAQTLAVLSALAAAPSPWRHGYDLARETGLRSGTLYPILVRLADRKIVEACWEEGEPAGRPRRHLYRLTSDGLAMTTAALAAASAAAPRAASRAAGPRRVAASRPLVGEG
jgi:PadR family transcriptional regulator, regulatory protein PadR